MSKASHATPTLKSILNAKVLPRFVVISDSIVQPAALLLRQILILSRSRICFLALENNPSYLLQNLKVEGLIIDTTRSFPFAPPSSASPTRSLGSLEQLAARIACVEDLISLLEQKLDSTVSLEPIYALRS